MKRRGFLSLLGLVPAMPFAVQTQAEEAGLTFERDKDGNVIIANEHGGLVIETRKPGANFVLRVSPPAPTEWKLP